MEDTSRTESETGEETNASSPEASDSIFYALGVDGPSGENWRYFHRYHSSGWVQWEDLSMATLFSSAGDARLHRFSIWGHDAEAVGVVIRVIVNGVDKGDINWWLLEQKKKKAIMLELPPRKIRCG